jgi:predicted nuclease of predicted toxin-antitoxin system
VSHGMNIYIDDDSASRQLSTLLQKDGHKISIPVDQATSGAPDPVHLTQAIRNHQILLARNARDFSLLHELVITSGGSHPGIVLLHFDNDPTRDLTPKGIVAAIAKLENSGLRLSNTLHVLNHWR